MCIRDSYLYGPIVVLETSLKDKSAFPLSDIVEMEDGKVPFKGYEAACGYCDNYLNAKAVGGCQRGYEMNYELCGANTEPAPPCPHCHEYKTAAASYKARERELEGLLREAGDALRDVLSECQGWKNSIPVRRMECVYNNHFTPPAATKPKGGTMTLKEKVAKLRELMKDAPAMPWGVEGTEDGWAIVDPAKRGIYDYLFSITEADHKATGFIIAAINALPELLDAAEKWEEFKGIIGEEQESVETFYTTSGDTEEKTDD
jgi:hypothetical protein